MKWNVSTYTQDCTVNKGGNKTKPYVAFLHSPTLGDQAPYAGVAPVFQGVMAGDMPLMGLGAEPKNIPVAVVEKAMINHRFKFGDRV